MTTTDPTRLARADQLNAQAGTVVNQTLATVREALATYGPDEVVGVVAYQLIDMPTTRDDIAVMAASALVRLAQVTALANGDEYR